MRKYSLLIILFIILVGYLSLTVTNALEFQNDQNSSLTKNKIIRLHLIANSNTPKDQFIKRQIRQKVLNYMKYNKSNIILDQNFIDEVKNLAKKELNNHHIQYPVKVDLGNYYFPRRTYGHLTLPPGKYKALNIELGAAKGSNWWCVLNPPLCLNMKETNNPEVKNLENINVKFKIVELFSRFNNSNKYTNKETYFLSKVWKKLSTKNLNLYLY